MRRPENVSLVTQLFGDSFEDHQGEIIGVRTVDALTFLPWFLEEAMPVDYQGLGVGETIIDKSRGWFFMTPTPALYRHYPHLPVTPELPDTITGVVEENNDIYRLGVFATCFARNVIPLLKPDWRDEIYRLAGQVDDLSGVSFAAVYEIFTEMIYCGLTGDNWFDLPVSQKVLSQLPKQFLLDALAHRSGLGAVLGFLRRSARERRGLVVAFNRRVMQGEFMVHETDTEHVTHTIHELAIKPPMGYINLKLRPIVAIKPVGLFEGKLLRDIGVMGRVKRKTDY